MPQEYDLFTTNSEIAGFRLSYLELLNWGTFNKRIYRIAPQGNNSLLTGANASGKSTLIDALLTLLVPAKKDRFYNQSSGIDKKGDRTEETYVLGNYGNIQVDGESTRTQQLRDKNTCSILLASFENNYQKTVTLFQIRWFANGELKCSYGYSCRPLTIKEDFNGFNASIRDLRSRLEKRYNSNVPKKQIEFYDTIKDYKDRIVNTLGLRSEKALTLFNQIVGVKVLNDLDDFIRNNMLEQQDAESEYIRLRDSFSTLIEAKIRIEKVEAQIEQLKPIDEKARQLESINAEIEKLHTTREMAVYWFAQKEVELASNELKVIDEKVASLERQLEQLNNQKDKLKEKEQDLQLSINSDNVGQQIKLLEREIKELESKKSKRSNLLEDYNKKAIKIGFPQDPSEEEFEENRKKAIIEEKNCYTQIEDKNEELRVAKNREEAIDTEIKEIQTIYDMLQKNKNNISGHEAEIREMILNAVGAKSEEIPFVGELIRVKESEKEWENSIEKILHNFALRLIVPRKYYKAVNQFVNSNNLNGRIVYQRYEETSSLREFQSGVLNDNSLLDKIDFNQNSPYADWVEDVVSTQYNYTCVSSLEEFEQYREKAVTKEGLIKSVHNKHEKDDRPQTNRRENYVLGWDNKEKIASLRTSLKNLQEQKKQVFDVIREIKESIKKLESKKDCYKEIYTLFKTFEDINWGALAHEIASKKEEIKTLEATNDKVTKLKEQLKEVQNKLSVLENKTIKDIDRQIYYLNDVEKDGATKRLSSSNSILARIGVIDTSTFESENSMWIDVCYADVEQKRSAFQAEISRKEETQNSSKNKIEREIAELIMKFRNPSDEITQRFKEWRSDVHTLPDATNLDLIGEYQLMYNRLVTEDLVSYKRKFEEYLQETMTNKVTDFRMFFNKWEKSIIGTIESLNNSLREIDFSTTPPTYIQLVNSKRINADVADFRKELDDAIPNIHDINSTIDGRRIHFEKKIQPLMAHLNDEQWRRRVMDVRSWFSYRAEEFYKETNQKYKTYESMGQLSGGEKAQLTYTILGSAIAYQFGLTKDGLQANSFRFIAIDEAFKAQDEDKARYLLSLCKQLHLQLLVVTPSDNIHIVENDISFVHYVERNGNESRLFDMPIQIFKEEREKFLANDNAS